MRIAANLLFSISATFASLATFGCSGDTKEHQKDEVKVDAKVRVSDRPPVETGRAADVEDQAARVDAGANIADSTKAIETIGIPECDTYVAKYLECIDAKMPEASRKVSRMAVEQSVAAWQSAAKRPGHEALAGTCRHAIETAKSATEGLGCKW